jgi:hypothetical protein
MLTAGWNLGESLGLPVAGYLVGAAIGGHALGMVIAAGVIWATVAIRKVATSSVPGLLLAAALAVDPASVVLRLATLVTAGGVVAGAGLSAVWFLRVLRRSGLHVRFTQA